MADNNVVIWISGLGGVLVGAIGVLVAIYVNRQQMKALTISANRQVWINNLRDEISSLISNLEVVSFSGLPQKTFTKDDVKIATLNILKHEAKIKLLLNPKEEDHARLVRVMHEALAVASAHKELYEMGDAESGKLIENVGRIVGVSQEILKREWERVKKRE